MKVTFYVPRPSSMLVSNLLGVFGLLAIIATVAGLAGGWWALGTAGVFAVVLCALSQNAGAAAADEQVPAGASSGPPLKAVS